MLSIVPLPVVVQPAGGPFLLNQGTAIVASGDALPVARHLQAELRPATGYELPIRKQGAGIQFAHRDGMDDDAYRLTSSEGGILIEASKPAGFFYGTRTLLQLLPPDAVRRTPRAGTWQVPGVRIEDAPRFSWRGSHLDVARHFMPKEFVLKHIDLIAMYKLNRLHLHLTDDQGWRMEIRKYPKLTQVGAWRKQTMLGHYRDQKWDGKPHGGFYTQEDLREIVAYAAERFVTVVPEIEMPGHAQAAVAAYPELGNDPTKTLPVGITWGVIENVFNVEDSTISFLKDVMDEVLEIFPSKFIHVGGDECPKKQWKESPRAQQLMKERGLKDEEELQSWFIRQFDTYLANKGRRLIGWDEILEGGLAPGATVMSWRGEEGGVAAANAGHDVVMTPGSHTYFDHYQADPKGEPVAIGGLTTLEKAYSYEPIPAGIAPDKAHHVLGSQGQLWSEYLPNPKQVEYMAWPRMCALAEVVWSPKASRNFKDFELRMQPNYRRLQALDVNYFGRPETNAR